MSGDAFTRLRLDAHEDGVRVLTLDDPDKRNAIGPQMRDELLEASRRVAADDAARVLVVTGEGTAFCAGADLADVFDVEGRSPTAVRARQLEYYDSFLWVRDLPFPAIAAVNGAAVGAGLNLALVCDIVLAGSGASFGATFTKLGLHPGGGCTYFLTRLLGPRRALPILLLGATLTAEEAQAYGLAYALVDDVREHALTMAAQIAALEPTLARDVKQAVRLAISGSFEATIAFESWAQTATAFDARVQEGIRAAGRSTRS